LDSLRHTDKTSVQDIDDNFVRSVSPRNRGLTMEGPAKTVKTITQNRAATVPPGGSDSQTPSVRQFTLTIIPQLPSPNWSPRGEKDSGSSSRECYTTDSNYETNSTDKLPTPRITPASPRSHPTSMTTFYPRDLSSLSAPDLTIPNNNGDSPTKRSITPRRRRRIAKGEGLSDSNRL